MSEECRMLRTTLYPKNWGGPRSIRRRRSRGTLAPARSDEHALRFRAALNHLSNELARNDPASRTASGLNGSGCVTSRSRCTPRRSSAGPRRNHIANARPAAHGGGAAARSDVADRRRARLPATRPMWSRDRVPLPGGRAPPDRGRVGGPGWRAASRKLSVCGWRRTRSTSGPWRTALPRRRPPTALASRSPRRPTGSSPPLRHVG